MNGIQIIFLIVVSVVVTAANPNANNAIPIYSEAEKMPVKQISKANSECVPFAKPADCEEVRKNGNTASGVYTIWPRNRKTACKSVEVYCDMIVDGGGWTVIQRRGQYGNAQNYFHKPWEIYKHGFGQLEKEFWLGNEIIHALTNQEPYSVRFDMRLVNGTYGYAVYDQFWIENEEQKYQLNIVGYSGNASEAMAPHHRKKFSTWDNDNDTWDKNCAATITGGWWFSSCHHANLNGLNRLGKYVDTYGTGIIWGQLTGSFHSLEFSEIKIKPRHFR